MMDPTVKAKWIEALRSGKYGQAEGTLEHNGTYCCLGVLCVVQGAKPMAEYWDLETTKLLSHHAAGLTEDEMDILAAINDGGMAWGHNMPKHTFLEIADYIERML